MIGNKNTYRVFCIYSYVLQGAVTRVEGPLPYIPEWKRAKTKSKLVISPSDGDPFMTIFVFCKKLGIRFFVVPHQ